MNGSRYKDAGVDIDAAAGLVGALQAITRATARPGATGEIGGFGGLFDPRAAGFRDPVLVASTDGVGTKLKIAVAADGHDTIGIDLVAMCVNDVVVQGAEPLFFLDYFATGRLEPGIAERVVRGIAAGCREAGCALIGGETAEMPGVYAEGDYDLAGFAVGAAERGTLLAGDAVAEGDVVLGLASSGLHSNGFSLVRRVVAEAGLDYLGAAPFAEGTLGAALLVPTRIYVRPALAAHRAGLVKGYAHITGGGLTDNIARILPAGLAVALDAASWQLPVVFRWLAATGRIAPDELARTFNCGLGLIAVVRPEAAEAALRAFADHGEQARRVGSVAARAPGEPAVTISGHDPSWRG